MWIREWNENDKVRDASAVHTADCLEGNSFEIHTNLEIGSSGAIMLLPLPLLL